MSKIAILLCVIVVATLDASANNEIQLLENEIQSNIESRLSELSSAYEPGLQNFEEQIDKLIAKYDSNITHIRIDVDDYAAKAWEKVHIWVKTSLKYDIEKNLGRHDCFKAIEEVVDKGMELLYSATKCAVEAYAKIIIHKNLLVSSVVDNDVFLYLNALKDMPSCSSRYNETTQFELITLCNKKLHKEVNEVIEKFPPVLAKIKNGRKDLDSLLSDAPDCREGWDDITYQADLEQATSKAKTCFQQLQLEQQL